MIESIHLKRLKAPDADVISAAFRAIGWNKPSSQYQQYLEEQDRGTRVVFVAWSGSTFAGYVTLVWNSDYGPMKRDGIPEIQDLNVLPSFRRNGIGSLLLDEAERLASTKRTEVGIGVGLHPGYNAAQRLYVMRGYVPDGCGVTYRNEFIPEGAVVVADDDLVLHFRKRLPVISGAG
jgi:GNAT superfamily N-acetyltransferase